MVESWIAPLETGDSERAWDLFIERLRAAPVRRRSLATPTPISYSRSRKAGAPTHRTGHGVRAMNTDGGFMTTTSRILVSLFPLALVLACGTEADRKITGSFSADHTSSFSAWSDPVNLGPPINTPFNEAQSTLSKDGLTLFFASNRPEGPDDAVLDNNTWVSQRTCTDADDPVCAWQQPVSLGPPVNTGSNDAGPALSRDGHFFFSCTRRHTRSTRDCSSDVCSSDLDRAHDDFELSAAGLRVLDAVPIRRD